MKPLTMIIDAIVFVVVVVVLATATFLEIIGVKRWK